MKSKFLTILALAGASFLVGCGDDNAVEEAGENVEDAVEDAADGVEDAVDEVEDAVDGK